MEEHDGLRLVYSREEVSESGRNLDGVVTNVGMELWCMLRQGLNVLESIIKIRGEEPLCAREVIGRYLATSANGKVIIIGHSLGGLHARYYAQNYPDKVPLCITIGTPHQGTPTARLARLLYPAGVYGESTREMYPNSEVIRRMDDQFKREKERLRNKTKFVNIRSKKDFVVPYSYSHFSHTDEEYTLENCGHVGSIDSDILYKILVRETEEVYRKHGECPVVMLHGFCLNGETFIDLHKKLGIFHRTIASRIFTPDYNFTTSIEK
ncbi:alpha/beta fold hydrolase [Candidatus Woesearchaeota archaeon]|nr:alpha/beta fold hydrolase [Candidatus Woesearchaeota archaeon]